ncbi:DNRLRE domain-containing protein, partial [Akkermansiaceae bacterium]|nr:DNRLRE domain-containing protein [Akkermansiaceae bacterium]
VTGKWSYEVSFTAGPNVSMGEKGESAGYFDKTKGTFEIALTDKTGRDFRAHGRLSYVGKHHLQFEGSKEFFLKAGADAPENFLAYAEFDGDFKTDGHKDNLIKTWAPHVQDWKKGDPTWQGGKGKGIIGAVNYLAGKRLNVFSFLTMNIGGDDRNVFPYTTYDERKRLDCSRLDQWEILFEHGTKLGMYLHFKTLEAENTTLLDGGHLGLQRKLYYRELIARFSHHLALNWNLGEEVGLGAKIATKDKQDWASFFEQNDPYHHHLVIHNGNNHFDMLGDASALTGFSLQTNRADFGNVHGATLNYLRRSAEAGKPWVVACDEPGDATHSLIPDAEDPTRNDARKNALWGNLMAGGAGVEWYFGYAHAHSDLSCQDYRVREKMWIQSSIALQFFADNKIPFWNMTNANNLLSTKEGYCLTEPGKLYLAFLKTAQPTTLDLSGAKGIFEVLWFNPRDGGALQTGSTLAIKGGSKASLGGPPSDSDQDWLAVVRPGDPKRNYPPGVSAGGNKTIMLPRSGNGVTIELNGTVSDDNKGGGTLTTKWTQVSGPGKIDFTETTTLTTQVTLHTAGKYQLELHANDGKHDSKDTITITIEPFQSRVTRSISASQSAFIEGDKVVANQSLKIENKRRTSFIKFDLKDLPSTIIEAKLRLTGGQDSGRGKVRIFRGSHSNWSSRSLTKKSSPKSGELLAMQSVNISQGDTATIPLQKLLTGDGSYTLVVTLDKGGNDIEFHSSATDSGPELLITFEDTAGKYSNFGKARPETTTKEGDQNVLHAITDFTFAPSGKFIPGYLDKKQKAMAINAALHQGKFAAAEAKYTGEPGIYDLVLTTLAETDGESSYHLIISGEKIGEVKNPATTTDYKPIKHSFKGVELKIDDTIRIEFNTASNGKIPEGDAFAFARGRWQSLTILKPGATTKKSTPSFNHTYDASKAKKVHKQINGIVVVEAEDFDAVDRQDHRTWHLTTKDQVPNVKPDPDPSHAEGALGRGYLELLPDTRVTHADPLVNGVSFTNTPGKCSVLYYPVEFTEAGRYFVWVRMNCTGSEDNGIHVGLDGKWPESGARMQFTGKHGEWQWDSRQRTEKVHTGVLGQIWLDIEKPGLHTIMFSMREDGFEFDRFLLTKEEKALKSKTPEPGPAASPKR